MRGPFREKCWIFRLALGMVKINILHVCQANVSTVPLYSETAQDEAEQTSFPRG
jgi:hypothetical protein